MVANINPNTMAGGPGSWDWAAGETPRQMQQRQLAASRLRQSQSAPEAKPAATPAEAYRQQAAQIIREFGDKGREYVAKGMTYGESLEAELKAQNAEKARLSETAAKQDRKETGFAASIRVAGSEGKADSQSPAAPQKPKGFAAKLKFGSFNAFGGKHPQKSE